MTIDDLHIGDRVRISEGSIGYGSLLTYQRIHGILQIAEIGDCIRRCGKCGCNQKVVQFHNHEGRWCHIPDVIIFHAKYYPEKPIDFYAYRAIIEHKKYKEMEERRAAEKKLDWIDDFRPRLR